MEFIHSLFTPHELIFSSDRENIWHNSRRSGLCDEAQVHSEEALHEGAKNKQFISCDYSLVQVA